MSLPAPLRPLATHRQWINYRLQPRDDGRTDKIPVSPMTGHDHDAHDSAAWTDYETAAATGRPVGFVFTDQDPFFFLDIDDALKPDGTWNEAATWLCQQFSGCAVEVSQSARGLHIFGRIPVDLGVIGHSSDTLGSQFYTTRRFVAITGTNVIGDASHTPDPSVYTSVIRTYFPTPQSAANPADWTDGPCPEWSGPADDTELINRMLRSQSVSSVLGGRVTPKQLWEADTDALTAAFPDDRRAFDWSRADGALASHLAFWTGKDCERMDRLFRQSALMRDKWNRDDYRRRTILAAVGMCRNVYSRPEPEPTDDMRVGFQYQTPHQQQETFAGCCYVRDQHRIFCPDGGLLKPEQFRAMHGGYVYAVDATGEKTTRNAWEAFTESQALVFPKAHKACFRPRVTTGEVFSEDGVILVNTYVPVETPSTPGDPALFLDLLSRMLPVPRDREILLAYLAAVVQYPGYKFQWCPLIQGAQGNGKSFIGRALSACIGQKYTHLPDAKDLGNVFTGWLQRKLLIVVEEVYTKDKIDTLETLKWMITNEIVPVQYKGADQGTGENCANFILFTNHKAGVPKTAGDRRLAPFYTAQQSVDDIARTGMGGDYFPRLWTWAKEQNGWAVINHFLREYRIPDELNPTGMCQRAPETSSTNEALLHGMGTIEQEILEAVDEGRVGFRAGWISSMALADLMHGRRIPLNRWREIMDTIGFEPHPSLVGGRVNNPVIYEENRKPRLYVRKGHPVASIQAPEDVRRRYIKDQGWEDTAGPPAAAAGAGVGE